MSDKNTQEEKPQAFTHADVDAARAEGAISGAKAERERIQGIMGCDEAKTRADLSFHISMNTDLSVEAAQAILAASPEQAKAPEAPASASVPGADFAAAMAQGNPEIEAMGGAEEAAAGKSDLDLLIADYGTATGYKK